MTAKRRRKQRPQAPDRTLTGEMARDPLMTQTEVAEFFRVSSHTINRWVRKGALTLLRTLGGHKRFHTSEVRTLAGLPPAEPAPEPPPAV